MDLLFLTNKIRTAYTPDVSNVSKPCPQPGLCESTLHLSTFSASLRFTFHAWDFCLDPAGSQRNQHYTPDKAKLLRYTVSGGALLPNLLSNDILHLVVDQRQVMINLSLKIQAENFRMKS